MKKNGDRLSKRLTRGSQPGRRRVKGKRFSKEHQPKRPRGRPKGAKNLMTRNIVQAIRDGCADCGEDGKGTGGLRGYMKRLATHDMKTMGMLVRSLIPREVKVEEKQQIRVQVYQSLEEVKTELQRLGLPTTEIYKLEYCKPPVIDAEAVEETST
jgi:hypothetical protein